MSENLIEKVIKELNSCFPIYGVVSLLRQYQQSQVCPECKGTGRHKHEVVGCQYDDICPACGGLGSKEAYYEKQIETLQLKLAACGVAAMCNTEETIKKQRLPDNSHYHCASYDDVCRAVDREMGLQKQISFLQAENSELKKDVAAWMDKASEENLQALQAENERLKIDNVILADDLNYHKAVLNGSWPSAIKILEVALASAKAAAETADKEIL